MTDINDSIQNFLQEIAREYDLPDISHYQVFDTGYEDLNIKIQTSRGPFVVKVFANHKPYNIIQDYVNGLVRFYDVGIPVPKLLPNSQGFLHKINDKDTFLCIIEFFNGIDFVHIEPNYSDISAITVCLTQIHTLSFDISSNYDSWGTANLSKEYENKKTCLNKYEDKMIYPIVERFREINFSLFNKCIIHGDIQRTNILRNNENKHCILDLGCMDKNAAIFDLAIFLALFCFPRSASDAKRLCDLVLQDYLKIHLLTPDEIEILPLLIKSTFASYYLAAKNEQVSMNDYSFQTKNWLSFSKKGIDALCDFWSL